MLYAPDGYVELPDLKRALFAMAATAQADGPLCKPKRPKSKPGSADVAAGTAAMSSSERAVAELPENDAGLQGSWASSSDEEGDDDQASIRSQDLTNQASLLRLDLASAKEAAVHELDDMIGVTTGKHP